MFSTAPSHRVTFKHFFMTGFLAMGLAALPARAEDPKPVEKPAETPAARGRPDPAQMLRMQRERLDQLTLTADQKKKLDEIYATAEADLKKAGDGDRQALATAMTDIREKVAAVLTDEQKAKFQAARAAGGAGGAITNVVDRLEKSLEKLDLTADQKTKVKPVLEDARKKFEELRSQLQSGDRAAMREKFKTAMDDTRDKLKEILTPEQAEKLKADIEAGRANAAGGATRRPNAPATEAPAKPADK